MSIYTASGEIELTPHGFSTLSYKFPLKLMPAFSRHVSNKVDSGNSGANSDDREATHNQFTSALAFILSFGGGLVGGDEIMLSVDVASLCCLTLLTQVIFYSCVLFPLRPRVSKLSHALTFTGKHQGLQKATFSRLRE